MPVLVNKRIIQPNVADACLYLLINALYNLMLPMHACTC